MRCFGPHNRQSETSCGSDRAPRRHASVHRGFRYATFSAFAGVDPTDHRAATAGLPPIDSIDHSAMILGTNMSNARLELPIGTEPRASNLSTAPLCSSYNTQSRYYDDPRIDGDEIPGVAEHVRRGGPTQRCTTVGCDN